MDRAHATSLKLTLDQQRASDAAIGPNGIQGENVFITGPAGTGKTAVTDEIMRALVKKYGNPAAIHRVAPTHGATQNLKCPDSGMLATIQSCFRTFPIGCLRDFNPLPASASAAARQAREVEIRDKHWEDKRFRAKAKFGPDFFTRAMQEIRAVHIDEISMVSGRTLEAIEYICRVSSGNMHVLFGGKQFILTGDRAQLPTVQTRDMMYDMFYPLAPGEAPKRFDQAVFVLDNHDVPGAKRRVSFYEAFNLYPLWVNFRITPSDLYMRYLLQNVRHGQLDGISRKIVEEMMVPLEWRAIDIPQGFKPPVIHSRNEDVAKENEAHLASLSGTLHTIKCRDIIPTDNPGLKKVIEGFLEERLSGSPFRCKVGQTVVLTENIAPDEGLYNGASGIITRITFGQNVFADEPIIIGTPAVFVQFTTRPGLPPVAIGAVRNEYKHSENLIACRTALPFKGGASGTAHAWQGRSFEMGQVDLGRCFTDGQLYTMLSRARDWTKLWISSFDMASLRVDPEFVQHELSTMPPEARQAMDDLKQKVIALGDPHIPRRPGFETYRPEGRIIDTRKGVEPAAPDPVETIAAEPDTGPAEEAALATGGKTLLFMCDNDYSNVPGAVSVMDATIERLLLTHGWSVFEIVTSCTSPEMTKQLSDHCKTKGYHFVMVAPGRITGCGDPEDTYAEFAVEFIDIVIVVSTRERCRDSLYQKVCRTMAQKGRTVQMTTAAIKN